MSGDAKCKELCLFLMKEASVPYMQMLEKWVYRGVIYDPYQEVRSLYLILFKLKISIICIIHDFRMFFVVKVVIAATHNGPKWEFTVQESLKPLVFMRFGSFFF